MYVFRRQGASWSGFSGGLEAADVRVLLVTIRATQDGTVVRIRAPLFRRGLNLGLAGVSSGLLSVFGAAAGLSVGSGILAPLIGSLVAVPVGAIAAYATIGAGFFGGAPSASSVIEPSTVGWFAAANSPCTVCSPPSRPKWSQPSYRP